MIIHAFSPTRGRGIPVVSVFAGSPGGSSGLTEGFNTTARFHAPSGIHVSPNGIVYVADALNNNIRAISPDGEVMLLVGSGVGTSGHDLGEGEDARVYFPLAVLFNNDTGTIYVADALNHVIREVEMVGANGIIGALNAFVGNRLSAGLADGIGSNARFNMPSGLALDYARRILYVADMGGHVLRKVTYDGVVTTLAGTGSAGFRDDWGTAAQFFFPTTVAVNNAGMIFVADSSNNRIRQITPQGLVTTFAGDGVSGYVNGVGTNARFYNLWGVATDKYGDLYVSSGNVIRRITPVGTVSLIAGNAASGLLDGRGTTARFNALRSLSVTPTGDIFVADSDNNVVRKITQRGYECCSCEPGWGDEEFQQPESMANETTTIAPTSGISWLPSPGNLSWISSAEFAASNGSMLPTRQQIRAAIAHNGNQPLFQEDAWTPVSDHLNAWVSVGNYNPSNRLGDFYEGLCGCLPAWGQSDAYKPFRSQVGVVPLPSPTVTPSPSASISPSTSPIPTGTPSASPSSLPTASTTVSPTSSVTPSTSFTPSPTASVSGSASISITTTTSPSTTVTTSASPTPVVITWLTVDGTKTWAESASYAAGLNCKLASRAELAAVIVSNGNEPLFAEDIWSPTRDHANAWVSVGNIDTIVRLGKLMEDSLGEIAATWGLTNEFYLCRTKIGVVPL
jgi:hypothetical protein